MVQGNQQVCASGVILNFRCPLCKEEFDRIVVLGEVLHDLKPVIYLQNGERHKKVEKREQVVASDIAYAGSSHSADDYSDPDSEIEEESSERDLRCDRKRYDSIDNAAEEASEDTPSVDSQELENDVDGSAWERFGRTRPDSRKKTYFQKRMEKVGLLWFLLKNQVEKAWKLA